MKIIAGHNHGSFLYATVRRNGNYNLYEEDLVYGHMKKRIAEDMSLDELMTWRDGEYGGEYEGCEYYPEITARSVTGSILIPHKWIGKEKTK